MLPVQMKWMVMSALKMTAAGKKSASSAIAAPSSAALRLVFSGNLEILPDCCPFHAVISASSGAKEANSINGTCQLIAMEGRFLRDYILRLQLNSMAE